MARPQSPPIHSQLRNARTLPEQAAALRALKNEIVGHVPRKEKWIALGVLDPIVRTLSTASVRSPSRSNGKEARLPMVERSLTDEENVRLQALQLVASFANGGPKFLAPLHAAHALPALLANISPFTNPPQIVVAALRALTDIANAAARASPSCPLNVDTLAESLFAPQHLDALGAMLSFSSADIRRQNQVTLCAGLISKLCREERHQHVLTMSGILDVLSTRLASFAVRRGFVIPGAYVAARESGLFEAFPDPAPLTGNFTVVLEAISVLLGNSKYRAYRLVNSPSILAVFPAIKFRASEDLLDSPEYGSLDNLKLQSLTAMEYLLPMAAPITISRNLSHSASMTPATYTTPQAGGLSQSTSSSRTSLNKLALSSSWDTFRPQQPLSTNGDADADEIESPLIPWLIHLVRTSDKYERLLASSILASLMKAELGSKALREASLGLLVVPPLVDMIVKSHKDLSEVEGAEENIKRLILESAPATLGRLIMDNEYLLKAAFDCDAVKILSKLLKHAYEPVKQSDGPGWWSPTPDTNMDVENLEPLAQLGEEGPNPLLLHRLKVRESVLKAIAALAGGNQDYRQKFLAEDIIPFVVESLSEFPRKPLTVKERSAEKANGESPRESETPGYGRNPVSIIIAGCHVVRMLSRSVSILRTALVDYGVSQPILQFMKHPNVDVQIAATAAMANFVIEVSPVRDLLANQGVVKILCQYAHSENPAMRLNALWALKNFIYAVEPDMKKATLCELEAEWLMKLIVDDTEDEALQMSQQREASGLDIDDDVDMQPSDEPHRWMYGSNGVLRELDSQHSTRLRQAEDKLAAVREAELNPVRRARNDDGAIQEQGLNFIRNLIGRAEPGEAADMIDFLFGEVGQEHLFDILASKLRARVLHPFARRSPVAGRETRVVHPQAKIIATVTYILVHMAATRHRQLVVAQTELLKLVAQQSSNKDREVRLALCHLTLNLTSKEDDEENAVQALSRMRELRRLGYQAKMETLKHSDVDLDVRERAKTAAYQMELLAS